MATRTISAAGGNWNSTGTWDEGVAPTSADDVVARGDGTSGNVTIAATASCRSANFTNYTGTLTRNSGIAWNIGDGTAGAGNVALKFVSGMTWTDNGSATAISFISTSGTQQTITCAGKTLQTVIFNGAGGSWKNTDALASINSSGSIQLAAGTWDTGNQTISTGQIIGIGSTTRVMTFGSSTINLSNAGSVFNVDSATNLTINPGTSTLNITDTSSTQKTLTCAFTLNNVNVSSGGTGIIAVNKGPTFNTFTVTGPKTIGFDTTATATATLWQFNGSSGNVVTIARSNVTNATAKISQASGTVAATYCAIVRSVATGGAHFTVTNGTDNGNNSGWDFLNTASETGTGSDSGSVAADISGTESGTGTGAGTVAAAISGSESGTGSDSPGYSGSISASESGAGSAVVVIGLAATQTGAGVDSGSLNIPASETGTGSDSGSVAADISGTESGTGTGAGTVAAAISGSESGTGSDSPGYSGSISASESGAGSAVVVIGLAATQTGAGVDSGSLNIPAQPESIIGSSRLGDFDCQLGAFQLAGLNDNDDTDRYAAELGRAVETAVVRVNIDVNELGIGVEGFIAPIFANDSGLGTEVAIVGIIAIEYGTGQYENFPCCSPAPDPYVTAFPLALENGFCAESASVDFSVITASDTGTGVDVGAASTNLAAADTGTGAESIVYGPDASDAGTAAETGILISSTPASETGIGIESLQAGPQAYESGTGAESIRSAAVMSSFDTGSGSDDTALQLPASERGVSIDSADVVDGSSAGTIGVGVDTAIVAAFNAPDETGAGVDAAVMTAFIVASETGQGSDSTSPLVANIVVNESGTAAEHCWS